MIITTTIIILKINLIWDQRSAGARQQTSILPHHQHHNQDLPTSHIQRCWTCESWLLCCNRTLLVYIVDIHVIQKESTLGVCCKIDFPWTLVAPAVGLSVLSAGVDISIIHSPVLMHGLLFEPQISFYHYIVIARSSTTLLYITRTKQICVIVYDTVQKYVNEQSSFNFSRI